MTSRKAKSNHVFLCIPLGFSQLSNALAKSTEELSFIDHAKFLSDYWSKRQEQISCALNVGLLGDQETDQWPRVGAFRRTEDYTLLSVLSEIMGLRWQDFNWKGLTVFITVKGMGTVTVRAIEMAKKVGVDPKVFRSALRKAGLSWHGHYDRWEVPQGSVEH